MDFVSDQPETGQRFRALTVVDTFTRECLAIEPGKSLKSEDVMRILDQVVSKRAKPDRIFCGNGSEFTGRLTDLWAYGKQVTLEFSRPGRPTDNAYIESFNGSCRDECLNLHWFTDLTVAKETLQAWPRDYNESRPHRTLNNLSPRDFVEQWVAEQRKLAELLG